MQAAEEQLVRALLAPLDRVEAVTLRSAQNGRRRGAFILALGIVVLALGGVAVAASISGHFPGLSSANRPQEVRDVLSPEVRAQLKAADRPAGSVDQIGTRLLDSARLVGTLPSGRRVYALTTTRDRLCVAVEKLSASCQPQLGERNPITLTIVDADGFGGQPPIAYGVARDDVAAVTFTIHGRPAVAPVQDNFYFYEGSPLDSYRSFVALTVTLTDGRTLSLDR